MKNPPCPPARGCPRRAGDARLTSLADDTRDGGRQTDRNPRANGEYGITPCKIHRGSYMSISACRKRNPTLRFRIAELLREREPVTHIDPLPAGCVSQQVVRFNRNDVNKWRAREVGYYYNILIYCTHESIPTSIFMPLSLKSY